MRKKKIRTTSSGYVAYLRRREERLSLEGTEQDDEEQESKRSDQKERWQNKAVKSFMDTSLSMVAAGIGGAKLQPVIGKTPSLILGAVGTFMGYLTGVKPVSALGLGLLTAAYCQNTQEQPKALNGVSSKRSNPSVELFDSEEINEAAAEPIIVERRPLTEFYKTQYKPKSEKRYFSESQSTGSIDMEDIADKLF